MKIFVPAMGRVNTANRDGSEVRFAEIAKQWVRKGLSLTLLLPEREVAVLKNQGVEEVDFKVLPEPFRSEKDHIGNILLIYIFRLLQCLFVRFPRNVDVIYVPSDFLVDVLPGILCKLKNKTARLVVCLFLVAPNPFKGYENVYSGKIKFPTLRGILYFLTQKIAVRIIKSLGGRFLTLNQQDKQSVIRMGVEAGEIDVVSMGVNLTEYNRASESHEMSYDGVYLGRLHAQKGLPDLIQIWKLVCTRRPGSRLVIIGGGASSWFEWLTQEIKFSELDGFVDILGFKFGEEKVKLLKSAKCLLMPSHYESWGMTAVEAMACGLPVVAYDIPVFREVFPEAMVRVPFEDYSAFSDTVIDLLENKERRKSIHNQSKIFIKKFDWEIVAKKEWDLILAQLTPEKTLEYAH